MREEEKRSHFRQLAIGLMVAATLIYCWGIWSVPILSHNEARRMVVVQEMLRSGNWLIPTMNGEVYLAKPPLLYWLMAASCTLFHTQAEWAMRLPSGLMAVLLTGLVLHRGRRYLGPGPALFGGAILASSESFIEFARSAQIEMLLALTCTLSVFWFLDYAKSGRKVWLFLSYAAMGAAILTKGPVALIFIIPPTLCFGLLGRDRRALAGLVSVPGWSLALLLALPWFLYIFLGHQALLDHVVSEDIADKVAGVSKSSPLYTYPLFLAGAFAPWILALGYRPRVQWQTMVGVYEQRYFLLFAVLPVILMSLVAEKHGKYLLPIFPSMAMVLGVWCHTLYRSREAVHPSRTPQWTMAAAGLLLAGHLLFQVVLTPRIYHYRFSALKPLAAAINQRAADRPVYCYEQAIVQLLYYAGRPLPVKKTPAIKEMIRDKESFLLVAGSKTWQGLSDLPLCLVAEYSPFLKKDRAARLLGHGDFCAPDQAIPGQEGAR